MVLSEQVLLPDFSHPTVLFFLHPIILYPVSVFPFSTRGMPETVGEKAKRVLAFRLEVRFSGIINGNSRTDKA
jgi:hypothetical protein